MNRPLLALAALALAACSPDFAPASRVEKLRLLAVRADPPEIAPAPASGSPVAPDRAALTALVLRGDRSDRPATVLYLACLPQPADANPSPCASLEALRDPAALAAAASQAACGAPTPVVLLGAEACSAGSCGPARATEGGAPVELPAPVLALPAGWSLEGLPPGAPERALGLLAPVLAFAVDAGPDELLSAGAGACPLARLGSGLARLWAEREHVLASKGVRLRGPEAPDAPNRNPAVDGISAGVTGLATAPPTAVQAGRWPLRPVLPPGADSLHDLETTLDAAGAPLGRAPEEWVYSWFSTTGELEELHTREPAADDWSLAPGDVAAGGTAAVAVVVRDLRGGTAWALREVALQ